MSNVDDPLRAGNGAGQALVRAISARRGGMCIAAALGVIGLVFTWQASLIDFGDFALPGPGFFPLVLGVLVLVLAIVIGVRDWFQAASAETVELGHRDVLIVLAALRLCDARTVRSSAACADRAMFAGDCEPVGGNRHGGVLVFLPGSARAAASARAG